MDEFDDIMKAIDETDEILLDNEDRIKDPHLKGAKLRKHLIRNDKFVFDSGDYYKNLDLEQKMDSQARVEFERQAKRMECLLNQTHEKKLKPQQAERKKVLCRYTENILRQRRVLHEARSRDARKRTLQPSQDRRVRQIPRLHRSAQNEGSAARQRSKRR